MANLQPLSVETYLDRLLACTTKAELKALNQDDKHHHSWTVLGQRAIAVLIVEQQREIDEASFAYKHLEKITNFAIATETLRQDNPPSREVFDALCKSTKILSAEQDYFKDLAYFDYLIKKADNGHHFACHFLAVHYFKGHTPTGQKDDDKAIHYFQKAVAGQFPTSKDFLDKLTIETKFSA